MYRLTGIVTACFLLIEPAIALAGMPSIHFSDVARLRLETISFFLAVFLLSALAIKLLWNWLGREIIWMPKLSYGKAVGLTTLWGLLFVIVLTMISGARELMTPGAWVQKGATYQLKSPPRSPALPSEYSDSQALAVRMERMLLLKTLILDYAAKHEGKFPTKDAAFALVPSLWTAPEADGLQYAYWPERSLAGPQQVLMSEPNAFEGDQLVLFTDGEVKAMPVDAFVTLPTVEKTP